MLLEVLNQIGARPVERRRGFSGEHDQLPGSGFSGRLDRWSLLQDDVSVGSSDSEGTDSGAARTPILPCRKLGVDPKWTAGEIDLRIGLCEVQTRRNQPVFER